jgi:fatty-acyl-CoA synthase
VWCNGRAALVNGEQEFAWRLPADEWCTHSLNYTSGTTGRPKGVLYHHRGAALNGMNEALVWGMAQHPTYLHTLPMFHCNGAPRLGKAELS